MAMLVLGPATKNDERMYTADGIFITDGAKLWDDISWEWVTVHFGGGTKGTSDAPYGEYWNGWFQVEGTWGRYTLNGERLFSKPVE